MFDSRFNGQICIIGIYYWGPSILAVHERFKNVAEETEWDAK